MNENVWNESLEFGYLTSNSELHFEIFMSADSADFNLIFKSETRFLPTLCVSMFT